jgi:hypothetical protein
MISDCSCPTCSLNNIDLQLFGCHPASQVVAFQDCHEVTKYACLVFAQSDRKELIEDLYTVFLGGMIRYHSVSHYLFFSFFPAEVIHIFFGMHLLGATSKGTEALNR